MPVAHGEGCYYADDATLDALERDGQVLFRYVDDAGRPAADPATGRIRTARCARSPGCRTGAGNVAGLMPHPERASEAMLGSDDGRAILESLVESARRAAPGSRPARRSRDRRRRRRLRRRSTASSASRTTSSTRSATGSGAIRTTSSSRCSASCGASTAPTRAASRCSRTLPTGGEGVVAGPGENAGVVSIGHGLAVAFKIESHNHPSAVEPYQGAATGVGGILRDIFTMGARPIAVLDALRFGDPASPRTRHLVDGVVRGVGGYGNCVGVPTVGGELVFDPSYQGNPLVNVMAIGAARGGGSHARGRARARQCGRAVRLDDRPRRHRRRVGPRVGHVRCGGASKRPSVQVGDPFAEKLLIEASLELIRRGLVEGLQDLGAGGVTCATSETADRAGTGIRVELEAIPRREPGMAPYEVMISESQERMLAIVRPDRVDDVREVCERWGLPWAVIGHGHRRR